MPATIEDQKRVLKLQEIDNSIVGLTGKLANLPEAKELREAEIEFATARDLRIAAETELKDVSVELKRAEGDVEQIERREKKDEARLNAGQGSPKELEKLQHEIASLKNRRSELEEIELEVMMRVDGIKERIANLQKAESDLTERVSKATDRKNAANADLNSELDSLKKSRNELAIQIDKTLLDIYQKQISNGRTGAAKLEHGECKGCNLPINPSELKKISELPATEIARCEECRCILVRS